jgi:hypothetical protein
LDVAKEEEGEDLKKEEIVPLRFSLPAASVVTVVGEGFVRMYCTCGESISSYRSFCNALANPLLLLVMTDSKVGTISCRGW